MRWLQEKTKQLRSKAVLFVFSRYFAKLIYSFQKTDENLVKMGENQRMNYYQSVSEWVNSEAYKLEFQGELEEIYEELASKAQTEDIRTAYRLVLLKIKSRDIRLKEKAKEHSNFQAFRAAQYRN